jgi:outer membrane protein assembly factor BamB
MRACRATVTVLGLLLAAAPAGAADFAGEALDNWHQWRGPLATGFAPHGDPPLRWDGRANVKWKAAVPGRGSATPIVWRDRVFVLTAVDTGRKAAPADLPPKPEARFQKRTEPPDTYHQFLVLCYDRATGKLLWRQVAAEQVPHEGRHPTHSYAAGSPMTDGRRLLVPFGSRGLYCYDLDGKLLWQRDFGRMNTRLGWGEGATPVLHGDAVVVNWDQEADSFVAVLDARTGATRWKKGRDEVTSWATPLVVEHQGTTQAVVSATNRVRSYDLATGEVLWECGGQTANVIPSPVAKGGVAYCVSGYRGAAAVAVPLDARGDLTGTDKVLWRFDRGTPYVPSPLLMGERLYFTQRNEGVLTSLDLGTGKPVIDRARLPGADSLYASPVGAKGRIYVAARDGTCLVLKEGDRLEVLATNALGEGVDASPAIVGKQLFLRGERHLYCIEEDGGSR